MDNLENSKNSLTYLIIIFLALIASCLTNYIVFNLIGIIAQSLLGPDAGLGGAIIILPFVVIAWLLTTTFVMLFFVLWSKLLRILTIVLAAVAQG